MAGLPQKDDGKDRSPPNIFDAAHDNDVGQLLAAIKDGQSLSSRDGLILCRTPLHVAACRHSNDFLAAASQDRSFDPWLRDHNLRLPIDNAIACNNKRGSEILYKAMYAHLHEKPRKIDHNDNEPTPFFP